MVALRTPTVALVGNPNTGKSTIFNLLAGMNQRVGNYPGVTVETKKGKLKHNGLVFDIIDLPGTYSLAPRSPDEMLAVDVILGNNPNEPRPDVVVAIVDASNLERNLYLMTQVLELGVPVVIALNMMDVAAGQGLRIDIDKLSQQLGVPIVGLQASKNIGLDLLKAAIARSLEQPAYAEGPTFPEAFENEIAQLKTHMTEVEPPYLMRRLLLDVGGHAEKRLTQKHGPSLTAALVTARQRLVQAGFTLAGIEPKIRYGWIRKAITGCVERPAVRPVTWTDRLDKVLTHKLWGTIIFLGVMFLVFASIFWIADYPMRAIDWCRIQLGNWVRDLMDAGPLRGFLVEGVIGGVGSVIKFLPQILILFAILAILEDCGYMARAAYLMDRLMVRAGLNGKSFIPLLSSMACAIPGIMSARVIESPRDRLATILVAPLMSCSARLPIYTLLVAALFPIDEYGWLVPTLVFFSLYMIGIIVAPLMAFLLKSTLLRGETPVFVMEMPLYKTPVFTTVLRRSVESGWMFLRRAGTLILAFTVIVWALLYFPRGPYEQEIATLEKEEKRLEQAGEETKKIKEEINEKTAKWKEHSYLGQFGKWIEPAVEPLGWDWRIGTAALASFPAREVIVAAFSIIFGEGEEEMGEEGIRNVRRTDDPERPLFTIPVALSVLVFFALCSQCMSTLVVIKRETNSWGWPIFTFVYMTVLAYVAAFATYQIGSLF